MKILIFLAVLSVQVHAVECTFKDVQSTGVKYVVPVYRASADFFFDRSEKEAYVLTKYDLDEEKTRECFNSGKDLYPKSKIMIPTVRAEELNVRVMGSTEIMPLNIFPMANGHLSGSANMIWIPFSTREKVEKAIRSNQSVIEVLGELRFKFTDIKREIVAKIDCSKEQESAGVLNLFKRMGEIKKIVESRNTREALNTEDVLEDFLGTCVQFQEVDATSLTDFDTQQKLKSQIIKGDLFLRGSVEKIASEAMPTVGVQTATMQDI